MIKRVMLVDDDSDDRDLFSTFFADREDIALLPAHGNGLELIGHLNDTLIESQLPHLIVLDQNMPKMNGKQTLSYLKSDKRFINIITVIYSTYIDQNLIDDCQRLGASMVAEKPVDYDGYQEMLDRFLALVKE